MNDLVSSLVVGFTLLLTNELGDRTFFLTVMFCSGNAWTKVFIASLSALLLNSVVSIFFGKFILPLFLKTRTIENLSSLLLFLFGVWMVWTAFVDIFEERNRSDEEEKQENSSLPLSFSRIFLIIFLAEFGDRSQLATFALSASHDIRGIILGTFLGHFVCSLLACLTGSIASKAIPTTFLTLIGGQETPVTPFFASGAYQINGLWTITSGFPFARYTDNLIILVPNLCFLPRQLDQNTRVQATQFLERASQENLAGYLLELSQILADENGKFDVNVRVAAGLAAKNCLVARDMFRRQQLIETFKVIDPSIKTKIKALSITALNAKESRAATAGAQFVAALAYVELPVNEWPDLLRILHYNVVGVGVDLSTQGLRRASLEALGYICEEGLSSVLEAAAGEILSAVVHGLGSREPSAAVRQAAATALLNSLEFLRSRLEANEEERNATFRAIFEAIASYQGASSGAEMLPVAVGALECLVGTVQVLYAYMRPYMHQGLGELTVNAMSSSESSISLQGIEFWSTICDVELELLRDLEDCVESGQQFEQALHYFARDSAATVIPILLTRMASQAHDDEDEDAGDEWTPAMAAATCLSLYASVVADDLLKLPTLRRFIEENLASTDWHFREAAVLAFGSVLEGPRRELLEPLALNTFPALFRLFGDSSVSVRDTNMWALGRVCELHPRFIPLEHAEQLAGSFAAGLKQPPRVASSSAWALLHLVRRIAHGTHGPIEERQANEMLARILPQLAMLLMEAAQRADADEASLRSAAFEVLAGILAEVPGQIDQNLLLELISHVLAYLGASIRLVVEALSVEEQVRGSDIQSSCVGLLATAIKRVGAANVPAATWERLGGAFLAIAQSGAAGKTAITSLEDLFLALGSLLTEISDAGATDLAANLVAPFMPYVLGILARPDEAQLCRVVIGFVSDVARACKTSAPVVSNLDTLILSLHRILQSPTCQRDLKPLAITALGDLAGAVGGPVWCSSPHFGPTFTILGMACGIGITNEDDLDEVDFICELRLALIEAVTWIVQGSKDENAGVVNQDVSRALHSPIMTIVVPFLTKNLAPWCLRELGAGSVVEPGLLDDIIRAASGLIGDLSDLYPGKSDVRAALKPLANDFLRIVSDKISDNTETTQKWAFNLLSH